VVSEVVSNRLSEHYPKERCATTSLPPSPWLATVNHPE
jgi:hypothetical protein